ncbi:integrase core domain-containing protein [Streptomyces sp. TG1A-60]|uniref:integrase core domain-containing protein n=1 Tax=Streptomyces sp. TG1A-60 TaxID=3129111 RepID=UPI0030CDF2F2
MGLWQRDRDQRPPLPGELVHHSDAGSQYTSFAPAEHLEKAGIAASIGSVGDAYDNALMESTIGLLETEVIKPQRPWRSLAQVELATAEWADWYNHTRLHEIGTRFWPDRATARAGIFDFIEAFYNRRRLRKHVRWGYLTPHETRLRYQQDQALAA